jgi:type I restriction enzyme S subunit
MTEPSKVKAGWRRVKFGDVVRLSKSRSQDPLADGIERYVGLEHLEPGDLRIRSWGNVADSVTFTSVFQPGQVLFGKRRAYQRKVAVADFTGVCSGDIYVMESKDAQLLLPELLPFICQTDAFFDHAVGTSAGSLSPRTNWTSLAEFEFLLPHIDLQEQLTKRLIAIRDAIHATEDAFFDSIQLTQSLRNSLLEKITSDVGSSLLGKHAEGLMGFAFRSEDFVQNGVQLLRMGCLYGRQLDLNRDPVFLPPEFEHQHAKFVIHPGDIVLSMTGTTGKQDYGFAVKIPDEAPSLLLNQRVIKIVPDQSLCTHYLLQVLWSSDFLAQVYRLSPGSKQANLSKSDLMKIGIPVPSLDKQREVTEMISNCMKTTDLLFLRAGNLKDILKLQQNGLPNLLGEPLV